MDETNQAVKTNDDSEYCNAGPEPLPTFLHPEHGTLTIYGFDGRSKLCRDVAGKKYRIGTRVVNRLRSAEKRTLALPMPPVDLAEQVRTQLAAMPDDPVRVRLARDIWAVADSFLGN